MKACFCGVSLLLGSHGSDSRSVIASSRKHLPTSGPTSILFRLRRRRWISERKEKSAVTSFQRGLGTESDILDPDILCVPRFRRLHLSSRRLTKPIPTIRLRFPRSKAEPVLRRPKRLGPDSRLNKRERGDDDDDDDDVVSS